MSLISLIFVFVVVGFILYIINRFMPMEQNVKTMMNAVVLILLALWVISALFPGIGNIRIGPH